MATNQVYFKSPRTLIEPTAFIGIAFLAGSTRLIQFFPNASKTGLFCAAGLGSVSVIGSRAAFPNDQNNRRIFIVVGLAISTLLAPSISKELTGRVDLNMRASFRFAFSEAILVEVVEISEGFFPKGVEISKPEKAKPPESVLIKGSINQLKYGREICSGATLIFLNTVLKKGQDSITSPMIDSILKDGSELYLKGLDKKRRQAQINGVSQIEAQSRQLHSFDLIEFVELKTRISPHSIKTQNKTDLKKGIQKVVESTLLPLAQSENRSGMTISFNGKIYAISVEMNEEKPQFIFFDSHGADIADNMAYVYKTNDLNDLTRFIGEVVGFISRKVEGKEAEGLSPEELAIISMPLDGDNEIGFFVVE